MAQFTASVQLNADAAPAGTGGEYQYEIIFGPSQVARRPKISAKISEEIVTRFMSAPYQLSAARIALTSPHVHL